MPSKSTPFTPSSILFRPRRNPAFDWALVEAPGTAPGSERFITTAVYRHSRLAPAPPNIGGEGLTKKERLRRRDLWRRARRCGWRKHLRPGASHRRRLRADPSSHAPSPTSPSPPLRRRPPRRAAARTSPAAAELFLAFATISICGFGGVLPWARRIDRRRKRWMTPEEFNEAFALCQFLPGANVVNISVVFGSRMRGAAGRAGRAARAARSAVVLVIVAGILYRHYGALPDLRGMLAGLAAAAAGLHHRHGAPDGGADLRQGACGPAPLIARCDLRRRRRAAAAVAAGARGAGAAQHRARLVVARR